MKTLHLSIIASLMLVLFTLHMENLHDAHATCVMINGTEECSTPPPILTSITSYYVPSQTINLVGVSRSNSMMQIDLVDPNNSVKNSVVFQSDSSGRFQNQMAIPTDAVNGTWKINISSGITHSTRYITVISKNLQDNQTNPNHSNPTPFPQYPMTPLQQLKSGIKKPDIKCNQDFILIIKKEGHWPACVNPDTVSKLVLRGWTENPLGELLLKYGNQTQANLVFYEIMNEPKVRDWSMKGWKYDSYSYASNSETQKFSATIYLSLPHNVGNHFECQNGSYALVVMNLKPVEIEHNYTEVGCNIDKLTTNLDPELNRK